MRRLVAALALSVAVACGGDSATTQPTQTGTVIFRLDSQTCTGSGVLNFFLDGKTIGTGSLAVGGTDQTFPNQPAGQHVLGASETRTGGFVWPSKSVTIPAGGSYTHVLLCS